MFNIYANKYAPIDPLVPPCDINLIPIGHVGEGQTRCLVFDLTDCITKLGEGTWQISFVRPGDNACYICTNVEQLDNSAIWVITNTDTAYAGYGVVQLMYFPTSGGTAKTSQYRTVTFESNGIPGDAPDPYEGLLEQIAQLTSQATAAASTATAAAQAASTTVEEGVRTERSQRIAADEDLQTQITSLMGAVGGPLTAATAAAMTDTNKVYVYVGNESGYNYGHWYYYAGANWADGGVYNATALETDPTLSVEGMAADAAACGDLKSQIYSAFVEEAASGSIASFTDGADDVPVADLVVNITAVQSGTGDPSPTNVRSISGFTEANIVRSGKNMLDQTAFVQGPISGAGVDTNVYIRLRSPFVRVNAGQKYTFQCNSEVLIFELHRYDANQNWLGYVSVNQTQTTYTVPSDTAWMKVLIRKSDNTPVTVGELTAFQMEVGDTKTDYEPYNGNTYNVSFGSAGTVYGGTLDVTTGMLTITYVMVDMGTLNWGYSSSDVRFIVTNLPIVANADTEHVANILCPIYKPVGYRYVSGSYSNDNVMACGLFSGTTYLVVKNTSYTAAGVFKSAMSGIPLVYETTNPVSIQLSATEVRTLLENNNIWSDTGSVASLEYRADTQLYIEKLTNPDNDMTADSNIASGQYFMVNNTLYLATAAIASGATIVPGTNCTETSLAAALNAINA